MLQARIKEDIMGDLARVNTNIAALRAFLTLNVINERILKFQEQISTGKRINRASDDPSGYFAAKVLNSDINIESKKILQIERGVNFLQSNSSKLDTVADLLLEISGLVSAANSGAVSSAEKVAIQQDINQLRLEIEAILQSGVSSKVYTGFNLGGLENESISGAAATSNLTTTPLESLTIDGTNINVTGASSVTTTSLNNVSEALETVLEQNERLGSFIRRLQFEKSDAERTVTDLKASLSTIQDADLAEVQLDLTKNQILQQTALAMLAQANAAPQSVLVLFGG
jgi:flagellin